MGKATREDAATQSAEVFALPQKADPAASPVRSLALPLWAFSRAAGLLTFILAPIGTGPPREPP